MRPDIKLVDLNDQNSTYGSQRIEQTIWGLSDLRKGIVHTDPDSPILPEIENRLCLLTRGYCNQISHGFVVEQIASVGYMESRDEVEKVIAGDFKDIPTDHGLRIDGIYVIGFVGLIQAGKTLAGYLMSDIYGTRHYPFIDGLFAFAYAMGLNPLEMTRSQLVNEVNDVIKPYLGHDRFAKTTLQRARREQQLKPATAITCDGFRSSSEGRLVLSQQKGLLVSIAANIEERYARACRKKAKSQQPKSFTEFKRQSDYEEQAMMTQVFALAQASPIDNNSNDGGEHLREQLEGLFAFLDINRQLAAGT